ncbi:MAG: IS1634 family transposase, partial [Thermoplasmatota archaeon]
QPEATNIEYDAKCDGLFPLLTNDRDLPLKDLLAKYKFQPRIEKRHAQLKSADAVRPVLLKNVDRVEALLFLYFVALLVESLLEREVRERMRREKIDALPLYPEGRDADSPTAETILGLFDGVMTHRLFREGQAVQTFEPKLSPRQRLVLEKTGVPIAAYTGAAP